MLVVTLVLVAVPVRRYVTVLQAFLAVWLAVVVATLLGAVVRGAGMALEEMRAIRRASGAGRRRRSRRVDAGGPTLRRR